MKEILNNLKYEGIKKTICDNTKREDLKQTLFYYLIKGFILKTKNN